MIAQADFLSIAPELAKIIVVRRQDDAASSARALRRSGREEGHLIRLHRPPEIVEFGVLVERLGISGGGLGVGVGADDLRLPLPLGADILRLLLAGGAHPAIGGI